MADTAAAVLCAGVLVSGLGGHRAANSTLPPDRPPPPQEVWDPENRTISVKQFVSNKSLRSIFYICCFLVNEKKEKLLQSFCLFVLICLCFPSLSVASALQPVDACKYAARGLWSGRESEVLYQARAPFFAKGINDANTGPCWERRSVELPLQGLCQQDSFGSQCLRASLCGAQTLC